MLDAAQCVCHASLRSFTSCGKSFSTPSPRRRRESPRKRYLRITSGLPVIGPELGWSALAEGAKRIGIARSPAGEMGVTFSWLLTITVGGYSHAVAIRAQVVGSSRLRRNRILKLAKHAGRLQAVS